ncbi:cell division FtsZ family protein [Akkermansiaceae bacterium]|nr:cell division FtsZ family protein [Akkermansiaceae bacterium]MDA7887853.1 cell division FtsZ family protein [Akkermansiaceae bacterium]MDB4544497.1 cell division FtsZ family protein [Akkermansiaceae bacterium]
MIEFPRDRQQTIPESAVKIIGLGGAGANMLDRIALDGIEGAELLALNTDLRTLNSSVAGEKIQLGRNLTKGLGAGGDPEIGEKAILESEDEIRDALRDRKIIFICVGLGGGTGSGAAPIVVRLAREAGAFVVVFATMPFGFEGNRRRVQAEEALNQLAVLTNALVTFDNTRMGELVLPKQGVHEAFSAADRMISDSITAVARLVLRPGLINVGLDELMAALKTTRSRCLFGSGLGRGDNRAQAALKAALGSPLLDSGSLLEDATTVLVHICGGEDMTLFEIELLMEGLTKHIPDNAHLLFGAATDKAMGKGLSVTIISALPEERLQSAQVFAKPEEAEVIEIDGLEEELAEEEVLEVKEELSDAEPEGLEDEEIVEAEEEEVVEEEQEEEIPELDDEGQDFSSPELRVVDEEAEEALVEEPEQEAEPEPVAEEAPQEQTKTGAGQAELLLEGGPKGRFEGEQPNVIEGEDLDVPPYLRKKRRNR